MSATFNDLLFKAHPRHPNGIHARLTFPNGYGVSVIRSPYSYGGRQGLYELAVLGADGQLTYETPVTDDVLGNLTVEEVTDAMAQVAALPNIETSQ